MISSIAPIQKIQEELERLSLEKSFSQAQRVIFSVIGLLDPAVSEKDPEAYFQLFTDSDGKIRANAGWFFEDSMIADRKAVYKVHGENLLGIDFKAYGVNKASKRIVSWATGVTPNFEDEAFNGRYGVGIDFIVPKSCDRVIVVLTNNYIVRTLELKGKLTATYQEILAKWVAIKDFSNKKEFHSILWESFDLQPLNKKFYAGISERFILLRQHLEKEGIFDQKHASYFANRLMGRVIFCWFLDHKNVLNSDKKYFDAKTYPSSTDYYRGRLETLFYRVLNTPVSDREPMVQDDMTPFLNGGLFEPRATDLFENPKLTFPKNYFDDLFEFLSGYNFTTDESTSQFQQVAIDPEMLGRIFENLLAEMTEETGEQARKAKGAFYTPREIVDYMCRESLREYLKTKLPEDEFRDKRLEQLIDRPDKEFQDQDHNWRRDWKPYKEVIIKALDELTVLDPACGSGAFPIGMLQLLVQVYERLESRFDSYRTKLQIIEKNLYGVDIEPMAVEIARLRAWLSIIVDEEADSKKIKPLPNLEFKFICANSLIDLDQSGHQTFGDDPQLAEKLQTIRDAYFNTESLNKKKKLRGEYEKLVNVGENLFGESKRSKQLKAYRPFDNEWSAGFFNPEFMFGVEKFDVVIGNPPYVNIRKVDKNLKEKYQELFTSASGQYDLYVLFIERSLLLSRINTGLVSFITSNKFLITGYGRGIRKLIVEKACLKNFIDYSKDRVFDNASVYPVVILLQNIACNQSNPNQADYNLLKVFNFEDTNSIIKKLELIKTTLGDFCVIKEAIHTGNIREKLVSKEKKNAYFYKLLRGKDCGRYSISWDGLYVNYDYKLQRNLGEYANLIDKSFFLKRKLFLREIALKPTAVYDDAGYFSLNKAYVINGKNDEVDLKYINGILNSSLIAYYFQKKFGDIRVSGGYLQFKKQFTTQIPIIFNKSYETKVSNLVTQIISQKKAVIDFDTASLEKEIDQIVYQLYDLTEEEIKIVENN
jgi:methylase of polypeptide subunit release factors